MKKYTYFCVVNEAQYIWNRLHKGIDMLEGGQTNVCQTVFMPFLKNEIVEVELCKKQCDFKSAHFIDNAIIESLAKCDKKRNGKSIPHG